MESCDRKDSNYNQEDSYATISDLLQSKGAGMKDRGYC